MSDGNKRYLGDVFINEDNYEYQKQFFRDIIESYQWKYGGNFDASTLQEKTAEDFATADQGAKADIAILSPLLLGKTEILNLADPQHILTDAILIDKDIETDSGKYINFITWFEELSDTANLSEMLYTIYQKTIDITDELNSDKLDKSTYEQFFSQDYTPLKESVSSVFETFIDENNLEVTKLNADLVNGLRFRLITQEAYDNLPTNEKNYWRNVFIIKDPADIPSTYEDPMQWALTDGYEFRIADSKLQVKNELSETWKDICSLDQLLLGANIRGMIQDIMEEDINTVMENIQPVEVEANWEDYPFLSSSLHGVYAKDVLINNNSNYVTSNLDFQDSLKCINIDMNQILIDNEVLNQDGTKKINSIVNNFDTSVNTLDAKISQVESAIGAIQGDTTQSSRISSLEEKYKTLNGTVSSNTAGISSLEGNISNKQDKKLSLIHRYVQPKLLDSRVYSNGTLCYYWLRYIQTNLAKEWGWTSIGTSVYSWPSPGFSYLPPELFSYRPLGPVSMLDLTGNVEFILRDNDGAVYFRSTTGKEIKTGDFYASATYVARGALQ